MNAPPNLRSIRTREQSIELALEAMVWVMGEKTIPQPVRFKVAQAHTALHACRDGRTVDRMERERGLK
jgi:hypothetical protein